MIMDRNKLKNYRIVEVKHADGNSIFYIGKKGILWGWNESQVYGYSKLEHAEDKIKSLCEVGVVYHTVE